jgi:hypothetical protein
MHLTGFDRFVWAASFGGEIFLLAVLFLRGRASSFPAFTTYIAQSVAATPALYYIFHHLSAAAYRQSFWTWGLMDEVFQLLVFYELAVNVFCPTGVWAPDVRDTFWGVAGACAAVTLMLTLLAHATAPFSIQIFILRSDFFSAALLSELFAAMVLLSSTAGLPWRPHVARIAQGLGAYSMVCVARDIVLNYITFNRHPHIFAEVGYLRSVTYLACEAYWIVMLWQEAPAPRELPESMRAQIYSLHKRVEYDLIRIRAWRKS